MAELARLTSLLPRRVSLALVHRPRPFVEICMDVGRLPELRYLGVSGSEIMPETGLLTRDDIDGIARDLSFSSDNRAGLPGTLHRISAIRDRSGDITGLTCRIGTDIPGILKGIDSRVTSGPDSLLFLGPPLSGKTSYLRAMARELSRTKRVVIVDTSNEIGGAATTPHESIGSARRMMVTHRSLQHEALIEAVQNHSPECIIVDELGTAAEILAARTIAERGVRLISTAHGDTLENILANPTLRDLVGGVEHVTIGDVGAMKNGGRKTVAERRTEPTFQTIVELGGSGRRGGARVLDDISRRVDEILSKR